MYGKSIVEIKKEFERIKRLGWVKSVAEGYCGIGLTLEKLLNIPRNDLEIPDLGTFELKSRNIFSNSYVSLFNCGVEGPYFKGTERLKDLYGYRYSKDKKYKVLISSVYSNFKIKVGLFYYFKLKVDRANRKIFLLVFDIHGKLIEDDVFWSFDLLEEKVSRKLHNLALFGALKNNRNDGTYYKYVDFNFYEFKKFDYFIDAIERGIIRITFKVGVFTSGKRIGQIHDHGTSFEIKEDDLLFLYKKL